MSVHGELLFVPGWYSTECPTKTQTSPDMCVIPTDVIVLESKQSQGFIAKSTLTHDNLLIITCEKGFMMWQSPECTRQDIYDAAYAFTEMLKRLRDRPNFVDITCSFPGDNTGEYMDTIFRLADTEFRHSTCRHWIYTGADALANVAVTADGRIYSLIATPPCECEWPSALTSTWTLLYRIHRRLSDIPRLQDGKLSIPPVTGPLNKLIERMHSEDTGPSRVLAEATRGILSIMYPEGIETHSTGKDSDTIQIHPVEFNAFRRTRLPDINIITKTDEGLLKTTALNPPEELQVYWTQRWEALSALRRARTALGRTILVVCMGRHPRVGENSLLRLLPADIMRRMYEDMLDEENARAAGL